MHRIDSALEANPILGWVGSLLSLFTAGAAWFIDHADAVAKLVGLGAAIFGLLAGFYTWRLQRRAWRKAQEEDND